MTLDSVKLLAYNITPDNEKAAIAAALSMSNRLALAGTETMNALYHCFLIPRQAIPSARHAASCMGLILPVCHKRNLWLLAYEGPHRALPASRIGTVRTKGTQVHHWYIP